MKTLLKLFALVAILLLTVGIQPSRANTVTTEKTAIVMKHPLGSNEDPGEPDLKGQRIPSRPIVISISSEKGVDLPPAMKVEILYFDVVNGQEAAGYIQRILSGECIHHLTSISRNQS